MEKRVEEIVHAFEEEMERIVFNSNGKANTMDLATFRRKIGCLCPEFRIGLSAENCKTAPIDA